MGLREIDRLAVDAELGAAEQLQVQARRGDDDVGLSSAPGAQPDAVSVNVSMWSVTTDGLAVADRLEQVAVGDQAQPLVPRVVARAEVRVDVVAFGPVALRHVSSACACSSG